MRAPQTLTRGFIFCHCPTQTSRCVSLFHIGKAELGNAGSFRGSPTGFSPRAAASDPGGSTYNVTSLNLLQAMSPNLEIPTYGPDGTTYGYPGSYTTSINALPVQLQHPGDPAQIPVPDFPQSFDSIALLPFDSQASEIASLREVQTDDRNVRRRTSNPDLQSDTRQKVALRTEVAGKDQAISLLRQQLQGVQGMAVMKLEAQQNSFGHIAENYERQAREISRFEIEQAPKGLSHVFPAKLAHLRQIDIQEINVSENQTLSTQNQLLMQMQNSVQSSPALHCPLMK